MRYLFTLTCLLFVTATVADEADLDFSSLGAKKALRDYKKAVAKDEKATELKRKELDEEAANLAKTTRDAFVESLKGSLKQAMQAGNLEEANKIDASIKALKKGASPAGGSAAGTKGKKSKARIPRDAVAWQGHHYMLFNIKGTHSRAQKHCEKLGGHLVRIQSKEEQRFISQLARNHITSGWPAYWIDGTDEEKEGIWKFSDGTRMTYFEWCYGKPENDKTENHIKHHRHEQSWTNRNSNQSLPFICEWDE